MKIIYDIGANNGDDIPYYLLKSDKVIAVEANPQLCDMIISRFPDEVKIGKLIVENICVTDSLINSEVDFYIHNTNHVLSQFPAPKNLEDFRKISVHSLNIVDLVKRHGNPYYIKIDVEHYDEPLLKALFYNDIRPPYISAESHDISVFCTMVSLGKYKAFKLVDGASVSQLYKDHIVKLSIGESRYSFPFHSAGPFGEDVSGSWMTHNNFHRFLGFVGLGWKDIHATNVHEADIHTIATLKSDIKIEIKSSK